MNCTICNTNAKRNGKDRKGNQRFQCLVCNKPFAEPREKPLDEMRLPLDKAISVLHHLVEGCSIRSTERITGVEKRTILNLLLLVGERCEKLLEDRIQGIRVRDVQADEIWCFVGMKEKTKGKKNLQWESHEQERSMGDAYTFVAIERNTKLVLTWHLGRRTFEDTWAFTKKLARATADHNFQVTTDGFASYRDTIVHELGHKNIDFAQLIKVYALPQSDEHRYSPPVVVDCIRQNVYGNPDRDRVCTSHVERQNLTIRMAMRRSTRLTNGFSKKRLNLKAALALNFAYYNFCRVHKTLRVTPAMESGLTDHIWTLQELIGA